MDPVLRRLLRTRGTNTSLRRATIRITVFFAVAIASFGAAAIQSIHHGFDEVLVTHVSNGAVDYPGIASDSRFMPFVDYLGNTGIDSFESRDEKLAYLINAYNAFAIKGILDGSSPSSFFGRIGYFKTDNYRFGGEDIDLYDLERDVIIPEGESRIHFAINCASKSCPLLRSEAYRGDILDEQLDEAARRFINDPSRNHFDSAEKVAYLSQIFEWFGDEFADHSGSVQKYVAQYVDDPQIAAALRADQYRVEFLEYDWSLNGTPPAS